MSNRGFFGRILGRGRSEGEGDPEAAAAAEGETPEERRKKERREKERRGRERVEKLGWARFSAGEVEGQGLATNLSPAGAMIERPSEVLPAGTKLTLRLKIAGGHESVSIAAEVVRETESGFAVSFGELDSDIRTFLGKVLGTPTSEG